VDNGEFDRTAASVQNGPVAPQKRRFNRDIQYLRQAVVGGNGL